MTTFTTAVVVLYALATLADFYSTKRADDYERSRGRTLADPSFYRGSRQLEEGMAISRWVYRQAGIGGLLVKDIGMVALVIVVVQGIGVPAAFVALVLGLLRANVVRRNVKVLNKQRREGD